MKFCLQTFFQRLLTPAHYGCSHTKKLLFDFAEGKLPPEVAQKLEEHLEDCPPCLKYVRTYRETLKLSHEYGRQEKPIPPELQKKLLEFLRRNPELKKIDGCGCNSKKG